MSQTIVPDFEQFLVRLSAAVDAYLERMQGRRPQGTKTWLAQQLGCDRTTLYKYLDGTNKIPLDTLRALIRLIGLGDDETNVLLIFGDYGIPVPAPASLAPAESPVSPVVLRVALTEALTEVLPPALERVRADQLSLLTGLLTDIRKGQLTKEDVVQALAEDTNLHALVRALAGRHVSAGDALITFGAGMQAGNISIGSVAGGNIINLTIQLPQPAPPSLALHQLRAPVADFVGREAEIQELIAALTSGSVC